MRYAALTAAITAAVLGLGSGGLRAQAAPGASASLSEPAVAPTSAGHSAYYSAAQLYNAANAHARSGETALAVLGYERALVLAPTDPDLRANLRRIREANGLPMSTENWFENYGRFANPNTLYWIGILGLALGGGCLVALRGHAGGPRSALIGGAVLGFAMVGASAVNAGATFPLLSESIAMQQVPASVSPVAGADALFVIPAAATVRVLDRHGAFELIRDDQGREGWVAVNDLAAVIP